MAIALSISTNFPDVRRRLDGLQRDIADKATRSALNKVADLAKTAMAREITGEFNIASAKVKAKLYVRRASLRAGRLGLEAVLGSADPSGKRRALNLINFGARTTRKGLSVKIRRAGGRTMIGSGFIGNKGRTAFVRVGKQRLPIKPLQTIDVPQMFNTKRINAKVVDLIRRRLPDLIQRDIAFFTQRASSK